MEAFEMNAIERTRACATASLPARNPKERIASVRRAAGVKIVSSRSSARSGAEP